MENFLILLAGGSSSRFGSNTKKQFVKINNKFLFSFSLDKFIKSKIISKYIIVLPKEYNKNIIKYFDTNYKNLFKKNIIFFVAGGIKRYDSVYNALNFIWQNFKIDKKTNVLIHDSARPFVDVNDIINLSKHIIKYKSVSLATKVVDTMKICISDDNKIIVKKTIDREKIFSIKTPQGFNFKILKSAYDKFLSNKKNINITDDLQIIENFTKFKSYLIDSSSENIKITKKNDLKYFKLLI